VNAVIPAPASRRRGRPPCCPPELAIRIIRLRRQGLSYAAISATLNAAGIPTPTGRPLWRKAYVDRLLHTRYVEDLVREAGVI
jgi:hypothetical protein